MKSNYIAVVGVLGLAASGLAASFSAHALKDPAAGTQAAIAGDYVEARTASVMAGPCHYNGELVTTGRDALLAWSFSGGAYHGVDLTGVRAMAAITSAENLSDASAAHRTELAIDSHATAAQAAALTALLQAKCGEQLGTIVSVRQESIAFSHTDKGYAVEAPGFATLEVSYRTDNSCCVQPGLVWYEPLSPVEHRKVGYTDVASYTGRMTDQWQRWGEDSAFYGAIAF